MSNEFFEYCGKKYYIDEIETNSLGEVTIKAHSAPTGYTGACFYHELGSFGTVTNVRLDPDGLTFDWAYSKPNYKYRIKKIQVNPNKNATTVIFENGHVEVVKKNDLDPEADLYSVVAYAVAKYVYGSNSAFKREIRNSIFEHLEVK